MTDEAPRVESYECKAAPQGGGVYYLQEPSAATHRDATPWMIHQGFSTFLACDVEEMPDRGRTISGDY
jgi:hypothetical protein